MHNIFCATLLYCKQGTNDTNTVQICIFLNKKKLVKTFYSEIHWKKRFLRLEKKEEYFYYGSNKISEKRLNVIKHSQRNTK